MKSDPTKLPARLVAKRCGVSTRTLDRWMKSPTIAFPPPDLVINARRYWDDDTVDKFHVEFAKRVASGEAKSND